MRASYQAFYDEVEKRFGEVMSAALGTLYPDVKMISGIDVIYTVQMMLYTQHIGSHGQGDARIRVQARRHRQVRIRTHVRTLAGV